MVSEGSEEVVCWLEVDSWTNGSLVTFSKSSLLKDSVSSVVKVVAEVFESNSSLCKVVVVMVVASLDVSFRRRLALEEFSDKMLAETSSVMGSMVSNSSGDVVSVKNSSLIVVMGTLVVTPSWSNLFSVVSLSVKLSSSLSKPFMLSNAKIIFLAFQPHHNNTTF